MLSFVLIILFIALFVLLSAFAFVSSRGTFSARQRAGKLWLVTSLLIGALNLVVFMKHYRSGTIEMMHWIGLGFVMVVIGVSWYPLIRR